MTESRGIQRVTSFTVEVVFTVEIGVKDDTLFTDSIVEGQLLTHTEFKFTKGSV